MCYVVQGASYVVSPRGVYGLDDPALPHFQEFGGNLELWRTTVLSRRRAGLMRLTEEGAFHAEPVATRVFSRSALLIVLPGQWSAARSASSICEACGFAVRDDAHQTLYTMGAETESVTFPILGSLPRYVRPIDLISNRPTGVRSDANASGREYVVWLTRTAVFHGILSDVRPLALSVVIAAVFRGSSTPKTVATDLHEIPADLHADYQPVLIRLHFPSRQVGILGSSSEHVAAALHAIDARLPAYETDTGQRMVGFIGPVAREGLSLTRSYHIADAASALCLVPTDSTVVRLEERADPVADSRFLPRVALEELRQAIHHDPSRVEVCLTEILAASLHSDGSYYGRIRAIREIAGLSAEGLCAHVGDPQLSIGAQGACRAAGHRAAHSARHIPVRSTSAQSCRRRDMLATVRAGYPRLEVAGPAGTVVDCVYAEELWNGAARRTRGHSPARQGGSPDRGSRNRRDVAEMTPA